ncbi:hypothetical protein HDV02_003188 [Globomyces sp. JEL0801]|nr:hypothetical protein HDV02_003188 [Globomyces sp. JEL0801]
MKIDFTKIKQFAKKAKKSLNFSNRVSPKKDKLAKRAPLPSPSIHEINSLDLQNWQEKSTPTDASVSSSNPVKSDNPASGQDEKTDHDSVQEEPNKSTDEVNACTSTSDGPCSNKGIPVNNDDLTYEQDDKTTKETSATNDPSPESKDDLLSNEREEQLLPSLMVDSTASDMEPETPSKKHTISNDSNQEIEPISPAKELDVQIYNNTPFEEANGHSPDDYELNASAFNDPHSNEEQKHSTLTSLISVPNYEREMQLKSQSGTFTDEERKNENRRKNDDLSKTEENLQWKIGAPNTEVIEGRNESLVDPTTMSKENRKPTNRTLERRTTQILFEETEPKFKQLLKKYGEAVKDYVKRVRYSQPKEKLVESDHMEKVIAHPIDYEVVYEQLLAKCSNKDRYPGAKEWYTGITYTEEHQQQKFKDIMYIVEISNLYKQNPEQYFENVEHQAIENTELKEILQFADDLFQTKNLDDSFLDKFHQKLLKIYQYHEDRKLLYNELKLNEMNLKLTGIHNRLQDQYTISDPTVEDLGLNEQEKVTLNKRLEEANDHDRIPILKALIVLKKSGVDFTTALKFVKPNKKSFAKDIITYGNLACIIDVADQIASFFPPFQIATGIIKTVWSDKLGSKEARKIIQELYFHSIAIQRTIERQMNLSDNTLVAMERYVKQTAQLKDSASLTTLKSMVESARSISDKILLDINDKIDRGFENTRFLQEKNANLKLELEEKQRKLTILAETLQNTINQKDLTIADAEKTMQDLKVKSNKLQEEIKSYELIATKFKKQKKIGETFESEVNELVESVKKDINISGVSSVTLARLEFRHVVHFAKLSQITLKPLEIDCVGKIFTLLLLCQEVEVPEIYWKHLITNKQISIGRSTPMVTVADIQEFFKRTLNNKIVTKSFLKFVQTLKEDEKNDMIKNALTNFIEVEEKRFKELDREIDLESEEQVEVEVKKKTQEIDELIAFKKEFHKEFNVLSKGGGNLGQDEVDKIVHKSLQNFKETLTEKLTVAENDYDDIDGKSVIDLGIGCGMLTCASIMMNSEHNIGVDIDLDALEQSSQNCLDFGYVDLIHSNVSHWSTIPTLGNRLKADTVIMNPPFGTKAKGIDMDFLTAASMISQHAIYTLHKTSTRDYVLKFGKQLGFSGQVLAELNYDLRTIDILINCCIANTYKFHKKKNVNIKVDFIRFEKD